MRALFSLTLPVTVKKKAKVYVSSCPCLDVFSQGQTEEEAEKNLGEALKQNPNNPYALLDMGTVYQRTGRVDQAREMFEKVISLNPSEKPSKHSKSVDSSKTLKDIAADNLKMLPAKS